jgi:hypothetical protein
MPDPAEGLPPGTIYTCPMHPQIHQVGPGNCPICGMTLEPVNVVADVGENRELAGMTRRFWIGLFLTLPVFVLEMGGHIPAVGLDNLMAPRISNWIQFALSTPVVLWAGWPFFERAWSSVLHRSLNMFSLIALGTGAAYLYSLFATFAPGMFPAGFREMGGTVAVYFEAAAVITVLDPHTAMDFINRKICCNGSRFSLFAIRYSLFAIRYCHQLLPPMPPMIHVSYGGPARTETSD